MSTRGRQICLSGRVLAGLAMVAGAAAAPAATALSGFCLFARGTAIQQSRAGSAARQRMVQLGEDVAASFRKRRALLDMEDRTLASQQGKLPPDIFQSRVAELKGRLMALDQAASDGVDRIERTRAAAQARLDATLDPLVHDLFAERGCIVLMERNNAYIYANQVDLTAEIVRRLDARLPAFTISLLPAR